MTKIESTPLNKTDVLRLNEVRAYYKTKLFGIDREVRAVDAVTLNIEKRQIYGLAGESSSGKTTLIKTIAGSLKPPLRLIGGSIHFDFNGLHVDMANAEPDQLQAIRWRHLSYIMQGSMSVLNPVRRIHQSFIDFALRHLQQPLPVFLQTVHAHLERLHLSPNVLKAYPHELSGGMRQRVAIALATVCQPEFIIADEPTTALDVVVQKSVLEMIRNVQQEIGSSMLFVTHDLAVHANLTDRLGIMYAGRLVEEGETQELFEKPLHPYTRHLISSLPRIGDTSEKTGLGGTPPNLADPPAGCRFHPRCPYATKQCRESNPPLVEVAQTHRVACFEVNPGRLE